MSELIDAGLLASYYHENKPFLHITGWHHQRIDRPTYVYPPHPGGDDSESDRRGLGDTSITNETKRTETKRNEENGKETKLNNVRTFTGVRRDLEIDWDQVDELARPLVDAIRNRWSGWSCTPAFKSKLGKAAACVVAGVLPQSWLADAIGEMTTGKRKRSPAGWLGKVLAITAKDHGVDFDAYQRQITIPEKS